MNDHEQFEDYYKEARESLMAGRYWEEEEAQVVRAAGMELRYYAQAGKLQIYQVLPNDKVSKGVVCTVMAQSAEDLAKLVAAMATFCADSVSEFMDKVDFWQACKEAGSI